MRIFTLFSKKSWGKRVGGVEDSVVGSGKEADGNKRVVEIELGAKKKAKRKKDAEQFVGGVDNSEKKGGSSYRV